QPRPDGEPRGPHRRARRRLCRGRPRGHLGHLRHRTGVRRRRGGLSGPGVDSVSEPNLDVTTVRRLPEDVIDIFWPIYRASFEPLTVRAAARHLLSREEFEEDM